MDWAAQGRETVPRNSWAAVLHPKHKVPISNFEMAHHKGFNVRNVQKWFTIAAFSAVLIKGSVSDVAIVCERSSTSVTFNCCCCCPVAPFQNFRHPHHHSTCPFSGAACGLHLGKMLSSSVEAECWTRQYFGLIQHSVTSFWDRLMRKHLFKKNLCTCNLKSRIF